MQYNALVTSIGGDLGKAVCKSLKHSAYDIKIFGADCKDYVPYPLFCNEFKVIPKAGGVEYMDVLNKFILESSIDIVYICSEQELLYICDKFENLSPEVQIRIAIPSLHIINICRDKYKTMQFLKENNFPYPYSMLYNASISLKELLKNFKYPFVVKRISDCGSKHLHIVKSLQEFEEINELDSNYMLQEYITGNEYTNAVYKDALSNEIYVITLQRTLKDGMSDEVKVVFDEEIKALCIEIAKKLNLVGSINIQLRKQEGAEPIIFEINPRYSSTAFMRTKFGFNDVSFAFENIVLKRSIKPPSIRKGEAYRYITEYYKFY